AEQLIDRDTERLARNVIERVLDAGDGKNDRGASGSAVTSAAPQHFIKRADVHRVLTNEARFEMQNGLLEGETRCSPGGVAFACADDPLIGINAHKRPHAATTVRLVAANHTCLYICNLHDEPF